jgi:hypothetical protein
MVRMSGLFSMSDPCLTLLSESCSRAGVGWGGEIDAQRDGGISRFQDQERPSHTM